MRLLIGVLLGLFIVGFLWHRIFKKMGFQGSTKWLLIFLIMFPFTSLIGLIYLAFAQWPVQVKAKRSAIASVDEVDIELDRLRGDMGLNQMKKRKRES